MSEAWSDMYDFNESDKINVSISERILSLNDLSSSIKRGFEAAQAASLHSDWPSKRTKMGCAIFAGSRLVSIGFNQFSKTKPGNKFFKIDPNGNVIEYLKPLHAEQSALVKIRHRDNLKKSKLSMFIYRSNISGLLATSAPCPMCQSEIINAGISIVHFFAPGSRYGVWRVNG